MADQEINTGGGSAIQGEVGTGGGPFAGRDLIENNYYDSPPPKLPADHPYKKYTLADVVAVLIGNDLTGDPGLVKRVIDIEKELARVREERQEKPITLIQVVSAILAVVFLIIIVLMLGIWLGGLH